MNNVIIYTLSDDSGVRYIGKTNNILIRYKNHLLDKAKSHKVNWIRSLKKQQKLPIIDILDIVNDNDWIFWEQYWISQFKCWGFNLVNETNGGENPPSWKGKTHSDEYRLRRKLEMSTHKNPAIGGLSDSWKLNISKSLKGRIFTEEHCNKLSKQILQLSIKGDIITSWPSIIKASKKLNIVANSISLCARGKRHKAGGYKWKFIDGDD